MTSQTWTVTKTACYQHLVHGYDLLIFVHWKSRAVSGTCSRSSVATPGKNEELPESKLPLWQLSSFFWSNLFLTFSHYLALSTCCQVPNQTLDFHCHRFFISFLSAAFSLLSSPSTLLPAVFLNLTCSINPGDSPQPPSSGLPPSLSGSCTGGGRTEIQHTFSSRGLQGLRHNTTKAYFSPRENSPARKPLKEVDRVELEH